MSTSQIYGMSGIPDIEILWTGAYLVRRRCAPL